MRLISFLLASSLLSSSAFAELSSLIPLPASYQEQAGQGFLLNTQTQIIATSAAQAEAETLAQTLRASTGYPLPVSTTGKNGILLSLNPALSIDLGLEGYTLRATSDSVIIEAATTTGLFYGGRTLLQLLPPQALAKHPSQGKSWTVPACSISDQPRFPWRGFMLDESRQFFGKDHVLKLLDAMALHKLNRFHWHLTDDEGWRIEIKSYPKLTSIGAWRGSACPLPNPRKETHQRYGGFYTQQEIRDIVAYAKKLHIEIMPEIDLPGHALAITTSYPEFLPSNTSDAVSAQGFKANAISPAKPECYQFIDQVITEIESLFPYEYIHIGGDEVNHDTWKNCPQIKDLMAKYQLKNLHEVQVHFTKQLEVILANHHKKIFGWNEVLDPRLDRNTGIMAWIGAEPGYAAANQGFPVVMAPGQHCYFDMGHPNAEGEPPSHSWAGLVDCARIYSFDPLANSNSLKPEAKPHILGVHSALWTEFVSPTENPHLSLPTYSSHADYKTWPRLAALAEVAWTPQAKRSYADFEQRLNATAFERLDALNIHYRIPVPTATHKNGQLTIRPAFPHAETHYTLDGSIPTATSPRVTDQTIALNNTDPSKLRARTILNGRASTTLVGSKAGSTATWSPQHLKANTELSTFDLSSDLKSPGIWRVCFTHQSGLTPLQVSQAEILINGKPVATDAHSASISQANPKQAWRFEIPSIPANAKIEFRAKLAGQNGSDSSGNISLLASNQLEPSTKITTTLPAYQTNTATMATDWDPTTFFWIAAPPNAEDTVTWTLAQPASLKSIECLTGMRNSTKDQAVGAVLEYSSNGQTWQKAADYTYGNANITFPNPTLIHSFRIRFTTKQSTWVIINDPVLH